MEGTFCPNCGHKRLGNFRYCTACKFDFDTATALEAREPSQSFKSDPQPPTQTRQDQTLATLAGIAWLIAAALIGYLGLQQLQVASVAGTYGLSANDYRQAAIWNLVSSGITLLFGIRLLRRPTAGLLGWSVFWAIATVLYGIYQINSGFTGDTFLVYVLASGAAGIVSLVAARQIPSPMPAAPLEPPIVALRPQPPVLPPVQISQPKPPPMARDTQEVAGTAVVGPRRNWTSRAIALGGSSVVLILAAAYTYSALTRGPSASNATPSPSLGTPSPRPTLDVYLEPGSMTFAPGPFKVGHPIVFDATFSQAPQQSTITLDIISRPIERVVSTGTASVSPYGTAFSISMAAVGLEPGDYVLRIRAGDTVISEGTFTLVK